jgi:hypothetical protein
VDNAKISSAHYEAAFKNAYDQAVGGVWAGACKEIGLETPPEILPKHLQTLGCVAEKYQQLRRNTWARLREQRLPEKRDYKRRRLSYAGHLDGSSVSR